MKLLELAHRFVDLLRLFQGPVQGALAQKVRFLHVPAVQEQAVLPPGVLFQGRQGGVHRRGLGADLAHRGAVPAQQGAPGGVRQLRRRLRQLYAAKPLQPGQEFVPLPGQGDGPQAFHLSNGHSFPP